MKSRLQLVLLSLVLIASSLAAFETVWGIFAAAGVFALAVYIRFTAALRQLAQVALLGLFLLGLLAMLLPAGSGATESARRMTCANNLKQIALALLSYQDQYGFMPPPFVYDKEGRPMHSWRVLILPFMEYGDTYKEYDFNEPWDGPHNRKLLESRPLVYVCPSERFRAAGAGDAAETSTETSYLAVVGFETAWQHDTSTSFKDRDLQGKLANTVMLIETADSGIQWTEPKDLNVDDLLKAPADSAPPVRSAHLSDRGYFYREGVRGTQVALADGSVKLLPGSNLTTDKLKRLLVVGGYQDANIDVYDNRDRHLNWPHCVGLPAWIVSAGLLLYRAVRGRRRRRKRAAEEVA